MTAVWSRIVRSRWSWVLSLLVLGMATWFGFRSAGSRWAGFGAVLAGLMAVIAPLIPPTWQAVVRRREAAKQLQGISVPPSLSRLLRADREAVPFVGRHREIGELLRWCQDPNSSPLRLLVGAGGVGKTRLTRELSARLEAAGWWCTQIDYDLESSAVRVALESTRRRTLLVVDYAETRTGLRELLRDIARVQRRSDIRVLIVARSAGEWWERLASSEPALRALVEAANPVAIAPDLAAASTNAQLVGAALTAFAEILAVRLPADPPIDVPDGEVPVLVLHTAALVLVLRERDRAAGRSVPEGRLVADAGVLAELLGHEERIWERSRMSPSLGSLSIATYRAVVALACLLSPADLDAASRALRRVPELADASEAVRRDCARWVRQLYPPDSTGTWWGSLSPDLMAEHLVCMVLGEAPDMISTVLAGLDEDSVIRALTVVARGGQHHPAAVEVLDRALRGDLASLGRAGIEVAVQSAGVISTVIADVLRDVEAKPEMLELIQRAIPYPTSALAEADLAVTRRIVAGLPADVKQSERASWLDVLSLRFSQAGLAEEALAPAEEAVEGFRRMAELEAGYLGDLANSLSTLGEAHEVLGHRLEALPPTEEAVSIYSRLTREDPRYLADLASSHSDLGVRLAALGRATEALSATEQAVAAYRQLARDDLQYLADLARTVSNLGGRQWELGHVTEAAAATEEAVRIRRRLVRDDRDRYLGALSNSVSNLGLMLAQLGNEGGAVKAAEEAVELRRELVRRNPGRHTSDLAMAWNNLGEVRETFQHFEASLAAHREALELRRQLAGARQEAYFHDLAVTLSNYSEALMRLGNLEDAFENALQALAIYRDLAAVDLDSYAGELSVPLHNLAAWLLEQGRAADALVYVRESEDIRRTLVDSNPDRYLGDLADTLIVSEAILDHLDQPMAARAAGDEARAINQRIQGIPRAY